MRRLYWFALAFAPSSLMLGVTTYLTTDLAAIPLLWLIPLALYLVSFMMAFARRPLFEPSQLRLAALGGSLALILLILLSASQPLWLVLPLHVAVFFVIALACHGHLARLRPPVKRLTEFYLWIGLGGVLGGSFNAILAPIIFTSVMEYPLALLLACALQPRDDKASGAARRPWSYVRDPLAIGGVTAILILASNAWFASSNVA